MGGNGCYRGSMIVETGLKPCTLHYFHQSEYPVNFFTLPSINLCIFLYDGGGPVQIRFPLMNKASDIPQYLSIS